MIIPSTLSDKESDLLIMTSLTTLKPSVIEVSLYSDGIEIFVISPSIVSILLTNEESSYSEGITKLFKSVSTVDTLSSIDVSSYPLPILLFSESDNSEICVDSDSSPDILANSSESTLLFKELMSDVWSNVLKSTETVDPKVSVNVRTLFSKFGRIIKLKGDKSTLNSVSSDFFNTNVLSSNFASTIVKAFTSPVAIGVKSITSSVPLFLPTTRSNPSISTSIIACSFTNFANS